MARPDSAHSMGTLPGRHGPPSSVRTEDLDAAETALGQRRGWNLAVDHVNAQRAAAGLGPTNRRSLRRALKAAGRRVAWPSARRPGAPRRIQRLTPDECKFAIQELGPTPRAADYTRVAGKLVACRLAAGVPPAAAQFSGRWLQDEITVARQMVFA